MADYDTATFFSAEDTWDECRQAREFVERIRGYLSVNGLNDDELGEERGGG